MEIQFQIVDISHDDVSVDLDSKQYVITLYGKTSQKETLVCHVLGYKPYFYIKIPSSWGLAYVKDQFLVQIYKYYKRDVDVKRIRISGYKEFYGYHVDEKETVKQFQFVKLSFHTYRGMNSFKKKVQEFYKRVSESQASSSLKQWVRSNLPQCNSCLYEAHIPPIVKFIHDRNLLSSGWVQVKGNEVDLQQFKVDKEIQVQVSHVIPVESNEIADFKIASFDIECDSFTGAFPVAQKGFIKPSQDIVSMYYDKIKEYEGEYEMDYKKELVKEIVRSLYSVSTTMDIEPIQWKCEIQVPDIESLDIYKESFIKRLDESITMKKMKESVIDEITTCLEKLPYSKNRYLNKHPIQGDEIIQIGTVMYSYSSKKTKRYLVVKGNDVDESICDSIEGIEVIECNTEAEVLLEWLDLMNRENPDYVTGYNILGFDFKYIVERAQEASQDESTKSLLIQNREFFQFGRVNSSDYFFKRCHYVDKNNMTNKTESDTKGAQYTTVAQIEMDGRILFDMQKEIMKGHNLESYKLDTVSNYFMRGTISNVTTIRVVNESENKKYLKLTTNNKRHLKRGDYITINTYSNAGEMLFMNGHKFMIDLLDENDLYLDIVDLSISSRQLKDYLKIEWCLSKDDVPPSEIFRLHKYGGSQGRAKVGKYCIQDCELCIHLLTALDILPNNMGMANVCMVPLNYIYSRGQGIKVTSVVSKICHDKKTKMPTLLKKKTNHGSFEGAIVLEPSPGMYLEDPIAVLDFASLYPSCIIEKNCSHETQIKDVHYIQKLQEEKRLDTMCNRIEYDNYKYVKTSETSQTLKKVKDEENPTTVCYFVKSERDETGEIVKETMGILPTVLNHLLSSRKKVKKLMAKEKNGDKKKVLDGLQLAYKVTANSVYGQLGAEVGDIFELSIAASTTSIGREHIYDAKRGVMEWAEKNEKLPPEIIYGDTDSVFVKFSRQEKDGTEYKGVEALKYCIQCGIEAGEYITQTILEKPQDLEYEKTFFPFVLLSKKRYIGDKYETIQDAETKNYKRTSMGIVMKRRDNAPIVKYVFGNIIEKLLIEKNYPNAIQWLKDTLSKMVKGQFDRKYFIISKSLNNFYKNPETIAHKVLADRIGQRDPGNKPKTNDRIPFMYIQIKEREQIGYRMKVIEVSNGTYKNGKPKTKKIRVEDLTQPKYKKLTIKPGDRIENPDYIQNHNLPIDYNYYITNQIMKPVEQVLRLHSDYEEGIFETYL